MESRSFSVEEIVGNLDSNTYYILCPAGLGDTYFICAYFRALGAFLESNLDFNLGVKDSKIMESSSILDSNLDSNLDSKDSKITLILQKNQGVIAELFDIKSYIIANNLRRWKIGKVIESKCVLSPQKGKILPFHFHHLRRMDCMRETLQSSYIALFQAIFKLPLDSKMSKPKKLNLDSNIIESILQDSKLDSKNITESKLQDSKKLENIESFLAKSCIFYLPQANSISSILPCIFEAEIELLSQKGHVIFVNSTQKIYTHKNAINVDLSLRDAVALSSHVTQVRGIRSGLFDLIAANSKTFVYYPSSHDLGLYSLESNLLSDSQNCKEMLYSSVIKGFENVSKTLPFRFYQAIFLSRLKGVKSSILLPISLAKIYFRNKNIIESSPESCEITQSYEYKLCENLVKIYQNPLHIFTLIFSFRNIKQRKKMKEMIKDSINLQV